MEVVAPSYRGVVLLLRGPRKHGDTVIGRSPWFFVRLAPGCCSPLLEIGCGRVSYPSPNRIPFLKATLLVVSTIAPIFKKNQFLPRFRAQLSVTDTLFVDRQLKDPKSALIGSGVPVKMLSAHAHTTIWHVKKLWHQI